MVKYCPVCPFMTVSNKLGRHILNKHADAVRKPRKVHIKNICNKISDASRKSYSVVPMSAIRQTLGAYWDDRSYRSIAHK